MQEHPVVMSLYLTLFGRIVLQNQEFFWSFMNQVATDTNTDVSIDSTRNIHFYPQTN